MADKQISQLPEAAAIGDNDLFVLQQGSTAKKLMGAQLKSYTNATRYEVVTSRPATGEANVIYLVGSAAPYHAWVYSGGAWRDLGLLQPPAGAVLYTSQTLTDAQKQTARDNIGAYAKPSGGIPATDMTADAQAKIGAVHALANALPRNGWNQMMPIGQFRTLSHQGVVFTDRGDGSYSVVGTATANASVTATLTGFTVGHVYFIKGVSRYLGNTTGFRIENSPTTYDTGTGNTFTANSVSIAMRLIVQSGLTVNEVWRPQIFDLSEIFGLGNELTLDQCRVLFTDDYYPFSTKGFGDLLWENAAPSTAFAGQNIVLDASEYRYALLLYKSYLNQNEQSASLISLDGGWSRVVSEYNGVVRVRRFAKISTGISIEDGKDVNPYGTEGADNNGIIPLYLYGIR